MISWPSLKLTIIHPLSLSFHAQYHKLKTFSTFTVKFKHVNFILLNFHSNQIYVLCYLNCCAHHLDGSAVSGLILKYKQQDEMLEVKLTIVSSPDAERKQALSWLVAMQKVSTCIKWSFVLTWLCTCLPIVQYVDNIKIPD